MHRQFVERRAKLILSLEREDHKTSALLAKDDDLMIRGSLCLHLWQNQCCVSSEDYPCTPTKGLLNWGARVKMTNGECPTGITLLLANLNLKTLSKESQWEMLARCNLREAKRMLCCSTIRRQTTPHDMRVWTLALATIWWEHHIGSFVIYHESKTVEWLFNQERHPWGDP